MEQWKTIQPTVWKPEKSGDNIIGLLVNKEPKDEIAGMSAKYHIENSTGTFFVWGSAVLDDRMQYAKIGQRVRITYEGKTKNKRGQDVNLFRVDVAQNTHQHKSSIEESQPNNIEGLQSTEPMTIDEL